ncbi:hypothetical protein Gotur_032683 [Gossypium turneri]
MGITAYQNKTVPLNPNQIVAKVIEDLDTSGDDFINGISKWLKTSQNEIQPQHDFYQETDKLVEEESNSNGVGENGSKQAWIKAIAYMVIGIIILGVLAEPLIFSVQTFSKAANIPSFFISFIVVPLRVASSTISAACRKKSRTTSLTFSKLLSCFVNLLNEGHRRNVHGDVVDQLYSSQAIAFNNHLAEIHSTYLL